MSLRTGLFLTVVFMTLGFLTTSTLWQWYEWIVAIQVLSILVIGTFGEHFVSSQGYYRYTEINGFFIGKVATWIPFMWLVVIQSLFIIGIWLRLDGISASLFAGTMGALMDFGIIEPICSRKIRLWVWEPVARGYFSFVPARLNRFAAPTGNYIVWYIFPTLMGLFLVLSSMLF